ncbi:YqaA family protein [Pigmentiphaga litoralis]|uniref:Membrane protein YqaA with SNARE-associated domain n=1 Tax=Pigmentiphaga litoralis TaxID=516702 RepID=A0A7Y9IZS1_9BURK|nr:YqaA family protein [Pigmentiphaga litoralis]NYE26982.1 membrane protein YqaA with SNARE-associated domain [Pigmentiphaga litoralis]NYE86157.1 membrane protein YqaA with SNARE-associated domain [Pigmentiphaga litoralis]
MEAWIQSSVNWLLTTLALPEVGLSAIFVVSLISATLLPLGSEPAVFGYVKISPEMFWYAVGTATLGNTVGGMISYWMGRAAKNGVDRLRHRHEAHRLAEGHHGPPRPIDHPHGDPGQHGRWHAHARRWLDRWGPKTLLLSWVPLVGDPLCAVAGWLKLDFWPSVLYMAIGKLARYITMTAALLWMFSPN